jgi:hypothetical protein
VWLFWWGIWLEGLCFFGKEERKAIFNNTRIIELLSDFFMNLDKNERSLIDSKKAEIKKLTQDILDLGADASKNRSEIKEKMRNVVSLVGYVISYPNTNPVVNKNPLNDLAQNVFELMDGHPEKNDSILTYLKLFGGFANSLVDAAR